MELCLHEIFPVVRSAVWLRLLHLLSGTHGRYMFYRTSCQLASWDDDLRAEA